MSKLHIRATQRQNVRNESTSQHERSCLDSTTSMTGSRTPHTTDCIQQYSHLISGFHHAFLQSIILNCILKFIQRRF